MSSATLLIVDDHPEFRRFIALTLRTYSGFRVVGETGDGAEAIQMSAALQPDLILLDIDLHGLNGIEAARQIRHVAPESRVVFLTQECSSTIVRHALASGATGYVQKARANRELLSAIDAVLKGVRFIGTGLRDTGLTKGIGYRPAEHNVQFYSDDAIFAESLARFVGAPREPGDMVLVFTTKPHREVLTRRLRADGFDLDRAVRERSYIWFDSNKIVARFMNRDLPDAGRFIESVNSVVELAESSKKKGHRVAACGEIAPLLWSKGNAEAAFQLERMWDEIVKTYALDTLCAYPLDRFQGNENDAVFERICADHSSFCSR